MILKPVFGFLDASACVPGVPIPAGRSPSVSAEDLSCVRHLRAAAGHRSGDIHAAAEWVNWGDLQRELRLAPSKTGHHW